MTQEQVDRILNLITQAADRLGFETIRIWPQMVAITFFQSLCWLIFEPTALVVVAVAYARLIRSWRAEKERLRAERAAAHGRYVSADTDYEFLLMMGGIALVMLSVFVGVTWPSQLTGVLYPEATTVLRLAGR